MNVTSQILLVPLSAIDHEDKTYCLTLWKDRPDEDLLTSIKRFGILHPPILHKNENNSYSIVTGNKRITAARHLAQEDSVLCRIVPENTKQTDIFSLLLEDAAGRSLSIIEQIIFFEKLVKASSTMEAVPMLEQLGYKPQKAYSRQLAQTSFTERPLSTGHASWYNPIKKRPQAIESFRNGSKPDCSTYKRTPLWRIKTAKTHRFMH